MKKIILALAALMIVGCKSRTDVETEERLKGFNIVVIDSCEYLEHSETYVRQGYGYFVHKGNCRFCKERKQKELEELITKLKKK